ncbi:MAG: hypothetical protein WA160_13230 [Pseudobdellovibrio sp.]
MKKQNTVKLLKIGFIFLTAFILSRPAFAFQAINETAELLPEGYYKLGLAPQLIVSDGGGFNVGAFYDMYLIDGINARVELGGGKTDFWTTASAKWIPIPDIDRQPAAGLRLAATYTRHSTDNGTIKESANFYNIQFAPIVSKKADTRYGEMIPYVALPITFVSSDKLVDLTNSKTKTETQFAIGAEWFQNKEMNYGAEFDLNLNNSFSSISAFISFPFDGNIGYKK